MPQAHILVGDALYWLRSMDSDSVQCCVTSPPYYGLRDYGTAQWEGGRADCDHRNPTSHQKQGANSQRDGRANVDEQKNENYRDVCPRCGACRVDTQIGLERTPAEYIARLVEVFREVRRVLRTDGVLFVVIGDSYSSQRGAHGGREDNQKGVGAKAAHDAGAGDQKCRKPCDGLKPKDLCMIPARLAMALQQPYYAGRIKTAEDRAWLAAAVEGEGCIYLQRHKAGTPTGRSGTPRLADSFAPGLMISGTNEAFVRRCHQIAGVGSVRLVPKSDRQSYWTWVSCSNEARSILREIYPHMISKRQEARIAHGSPSSRERATAAWLALKDIHKGRNSSIDFDEPPSVLEPGWWLRQDIIWAKPSPMPESVTDRCTRSHEHVFLLTKSARYHFDAAAISEPCQTNPRENYPARSKSTSRGAQGGGKSVV